MQLTTIVIDDDAIARKSLEHLCGKSSQVALIKSFEDAPAALKYLASEKVSLIILDVEMPGMTGLEFLDELTLLPHIIINSSKASYAYDAFEYDVVDFLKKPVSQTRFLKAIQKVVDFEQRLHTTAHLSIEKELYIKSDKKYIRLAYDDILYFENVGDYVKVISTKGVFIIYGALKAIDEKISNPRLLKVHRSFIVNMDKIKDIEENSIVIDKKVIPVSRAHKPNLMKSLNIL